MPDSPFLEIESAQGAVLGEQSGWRVPLSFVGKNGLEAARRGAGLVDLSAHARIKMTGKDAADLLQRISTNDLRPLSPGIVLPTLFVTPKGRIVDRALVLDRDGSLLLATSPGGRERLPAWIERFIFSEDAALTDISSETAAFAVTGPRSAEVVRDVVGVGVSAVGSDRFLALPVEGVETIVAPYDALPSAWLFLAETPGILAVYRRALEAGRARGLAPIGIEEAEVLRVEAGIPSEGHELTEEWNPWEVRLEGSFSLSKGCYTGQEVIARLETYDKVQRRLVGLRTAGAPLPAPPSPVYARGEDGSLHESGTLTSAVRSDRFGGDIGLAVLRIAHGTPGTSVAVGEGKTPGTVCALPFA